MAPLIHPDTSPYLSPSLRAEVIQSQKPIGSTDRLQLANWHRKANTEADIMKKKYHKYTRWHFALQALVMMFNYAATALGVVAAALTSESYADYKKVLIVIAAVLSGLSSAVTTLENQFLKFNKRAQLYLENYNRMQAFSDDIAYHQETQVVDVGYLNSIQVSFDMLMRSFHTEDMNIYLDTGAATNGKVIAMNTPKGSPHGSNTPRPSTPDVEVDIPPSPKTPKSPKSPQASRLPVFSLPPPATSSTPSSL